MARHGGDARGSSRDRRLRREFLKKKFGIKGGYVKCFWCPKRMRTKFEVDRYPICGHDNGTYKRDNIVPACRKCNAGRCAKCPKKVSVYRDYARSNQS